MYCYNCGEKLIDGAKFCFKCGTKVHFQEPDSSETMEQNRVNDSENIVINYIEDSDEEDVLNEDSITFITNFKKYFNRQDMFGPRVTIFGLDYVVQGLLKNIKDEFNYSEDEELLMAFEYSDCFEQGFLLTDKKFYWNDIYNRKYAWDISSIARVSFAKKMLASVMYLTSINKELSGYIYLTGIRNINEFALKFQALFNAKNLEEESVDNINSEKSQNAERKDTNVRQKLIFSIFDKIRINTKGCTIGKPCIDPYNTKCLAAHKYFRIPDSDEIYLILDSTLFHNCKEGFAVCDSGIFYNRLNPGYIRWEEFKDLSIKGGLATIALGKLKFSCEVDEAKHVSAALIELQTQIESYEEAFV